VRRVVFVLVAMAVMTLPAVVWAQAQTPAEANEAGKAAYARGDFAMAERQFAAAAGAMPNEPLYHYHRGASLVRLGRFAEARTAYERALALKPAPPLGQTVQKALQDLGSQSMRIGSPPADPEEIPLQSLNGVWLADVTLNGSRRARFLVDTGASYCTISPALAEELGMAISSSAPLVKVTTANGVVEGRLASLQSIQVGTMEAANVTTAVQPLDVPFDGVLGNTFLGRYAATLDAQRRVLVLKPR
jgi:clan AA aspartic protease (TIGR02281 family)